MFIMYFFDQRNRIFPRELALFCFGFYRTSFFSITKYDKQIKVLIFFSPIGISVGPVPVSKVDEQRVGADLLLPRAKNISGKGCC